MRRPRSLQALLALPDLERAAEQLLDPHEQEVPAVEELPRLGERGSEGERLVVRGQRLVELGDHGRARGIARGGRIDPASASRKFDQKPVIFEPKSVLQGIAASDAADDAAQRARNNGWAPGGSDGNGTPAANAMADFLRGILQDNGAIVGAGAVNGAKSFFTQAAPEYWLYVLGLLFIVVTLFMPRGIVGLYGQLRAKWSARGAK